MYFLALNFRRSTLSGFFSMSNQLSEQEFRALYEAHRDDIYRYLMKLSRRQDLADDLTQDVFVRVHEKYHQFNPEKGTFIKWACAIAHNSFLNHEKRAARGTTFDDGLEHTLAGNDDPAKRVEQNILSEQIREVILNLPEPERRIFYLKNVKNWTREQIAREMNMGTRTISRKLVNAVELLRRELEKKKLMIS